MKLFKCSWMQVKSAHSILSATFLLSLSHVSPPISHFLGKRLLFFPRLTNPHQPSKRNSAENWLGNKMLIRSLEFAEGDIISFLCFNARANKCKSQKTEVHAHNCSSNCLEHISGTQLARANIDIGNQNRCSCVENCFKIDFYGFSKFCFQLCPTLATWSTYN